MERILVIDADLSVQRILRRTLGNAGFQIAATGDGTKALQMIRGTTPGAVILEPRLPGKSGYDLCREIRAADSSVPIVVLSAANDESDKVLLLGLGRRLRDKLVLASCLLSSCGSAPHNQKPNEIYQLANRSNFRNMDCFATA